MKNELVRFENEIFGGVRCIEIDGAYYFAGKDIATALCYKDTTKAIAAHVDEEDKQLMKLGTPNGGGRQELMMINESGMYSLILGSKLDVARKFKRWVTSEVLPTLQKQGYYIAHQSLLKERDAYKQLSDTLSQANATLQHKVDLYEQGSPMPYKVVLKDVKLFIRNKIREKAHSSISRERMYRLYTYGRRDEEYATITAFEQAMCEYGFRLYCGNWVDVDIK